MFWRETCKWSDDDRALARALDLFEQSLCPGGCGHHLDETAGIDGWHEARTIVCDACAARDRFVTDREKDSRVPGEMIYVVRAED